LGESKEGILGGRGHDRGGKDGGTCGTHDVRCERGETGFGDGGKGGGWRGGRRRRG
jgi:hypothetical protein